MLYSYYLHSLECGWCFFMMHIFFAYLLFFVLICVFNNLSYYILLLCMSQGNSLFRRTLCNTLHMKER